MDVKSSAMHHRETWLMRGAIALTPAAFVGPCLLPMDAAWGWLLSPCADDTPFCRDPRTIPTMPSNRASMIATVGSCRCVCAPFV